MSSKRPSSSRIKGALAEVLYQLQALKQALIPLPVVGEKFGIIPANCMVGLASKSRQS